MDEPSEAEAPKLNAGGVSETLLAMPLSPAETFANFTPRKEKLFMKKEQNGFLII